MLHFARGIFQNIFILAFLALFCLIFLLIELTVYLWVNCLWFYFKELLSKENFQVESNKWYYNNAIMRVLLSLFWILLVLFRFLLSTLILKLKCRFRPCLSDSYWSVRWICLFIRVRSIPELILVSCALILNCSLFYSVCHHLSIALPEKKKKSHPLRQKNGFDFPIWCFMHWCSLCCPNFLFMRNLI